MTSLTFDTLKFAEKLIAAGVLEAQAKAAASALSAVLESNLKDIVTKKHLGYKLAELKADLIKWVLGLAWPWRSPVCWSAFCLGRRRQFAGQVRKDLGLGN